MTPTKGFIPVMLTPFHEDGSVDFEQLTKLTEFYLKAGAKGLFANCLSSEMFELTDTERLQIVRHVVEVTDGTVPVVATGTLGGTLTHQADFVKKMHDTGTEAIILITSILAEAHESDEVFEERTFDLLAQTEGVPVGFYECPVPYKRLISAALLQKLVATGRVIYHKDTSLDLENVRAKLQAVAGYARFGLYDAYMPHAVASLRVGSAGLSCIQGNYFPELIVWLCRYFDAPHLQAEVQRVQQFLVETMDVIHDVYPIVCKYFLQQRGFDISTYTRREVGVFTPQIAQNADQLLLKYQALATDLGI
ncbi:MAG: dihydrodipicolinate synthase family protein [Spirosomaceae bacterium]|nr:dihydrodipicolinate synthase family protein [Spirosomataceae bacterium]